ncbi:Hypothetical predicted protein, partial [Prunus dulcis]
VNNGVPSVCTAFLSGEPATRLWSQELQQLIGALLEFMAAGAAIVFIFHIIIHSSSSSLSFEKVKVHWSSE